MMYVGQLVLVKSFCLADSIQAIELLSVVIAAEAQICQAKVIDEHKQG